METFDDYLEKLADLDQRTRTREVLDWVSNNFPELSARIAWNQPMFTDHGSFIIGFSVARKHLAVAPEKAAIDQFSERIAQAGYRHTKHLLQMPWDRDVDFDLLGSLIRFNIEEKAHCSTFWRKS